MRKIDKPSRSILADPNEWHARLCATRDTDAVTKILAACARYMLQYWDTRYADDDKMAAVVRALSHWVRESSRENIRRVKAAHSAVSGQPRYSGYDHGLCDPGKLDFVGSDCPGDYAGDSIVWAAAAVLNSKDVATFQELARRSIDCALEAIARTMDERDPIDEAQDTWQCAQQYLCRQLVETLEIE